MKKCEKNNPLCRGIEPRSPAWQAGILTTILTKIHGEEAKNWELGNSKRSQVFKAINFQITVLTKNKDFFSNGMKSFSFPLAMTSKNKKTFIKHYNSLCWSEKYKGIYNGGRFKNGFLPFNKEILFWTRHVTTGHITIYH